MRILLLAIAALAALIEIALAQVPGQPGGMQAPDLQRRQRSRPVEETQPAAAPDPRVAEVERYFNSIRTLQARFVQNNPNGSVVQGSLYIRRPGRMRFEYDAPSALKIVADGTQVTMWDVKTKDFGQWPIGWTAASFLVKEPLQFSGDLRVENVERQNGLLSVTLVQARKPQEGRVTIRVSENPMQLRGWTVVDSRGQRIDVALGNVQQGTQLADSLFRFDGPDPSQMRRTPQ
ncbi:MAG TPA: outer-membrane lipoprotein carrier protein LolA [Reyranellaceae bacterium]|nr:outer-membrane lipoprotein carrier protein LolA [Reyranellaceae bacterium]